jgi:hypothetical protein
VRRSAAVLLAALAGLGTATTASARPGLPTVVQDDARLLDSPPAQVASDMRTLKLLGVDAVRLSANWSLLAPQPSATAPPRGFDAADPAQYPQSRWQALDAAVRDAHAAGLAVMIDVAYWAPTWAAHGAPGPRARTNVDPRAFAEFAVAVARRYSGSFTVPAGPGNGWVGGSVTPSPPPPPPPDQSSLLGLLGLAPTTLQQDAAAPIVPPPAAAPPLPAVDTLLLWNEPNFPAFFVPQYSHGRPVAADAYRAMVQAAYPAIKAVRPGVQVLVGNTTSGRGLVAPHGVPPLAFLRELACVDSRLHPLRTGACAHFTEVPGDGWAHHPYSSADPDQVSTGPSADDIRVGDLPRLAALLNALVARHRLAPALRDIYVTEYGVETQPPSGRWGLSLVQAEERQAAVLTWAEYVAERVPNVKLWAQFLLRDVPPGAVRVSDSPVRGFGQFYSGLLLADGQPKLAASTFRAGLFARRVAREWTVIFGRLRLGSGRCTVILDGAEAHRWRALASSPRSRGAPAVGAFSVACQGSFVRYLYAHTSRFLLRVRTPDGDWHAGALPVRAV